MGAFCLHRHPVSVNCLYYARLILFVGCSFAYFARSARCTVTTDLLVWYSNTLNDFSPGAAIFSLHKLASPSGRNVNCDEKQLTGKKNFFSCSFYLYRFRKYVSYGFPINNFCNPAAHYETSCISLPEAKQQGCVLRYTNSGFSTYEKRCSQHKCYRCLGRVLPTVNATFLLILFYDIITVTCFEHISSTSNKPKYKKIHKYIINTYKYVSRWIEISFLQILRTTYCLLNLTFWGPRSIVIYSYNRTKEKH